MDPNKPDIAEQWLSFPEERRRSLLAKMTPEQKQSLRGILEKHNNGIVHLGTKYKPEPGFVSRTLQGIGLPQTRAELAKFAQVFELGPTPMDKDIVSKGFSFLPVAGPIYRLGAQFGENLAESPVNAVLNITGSEPIVSFAEDASKRNYAGGLGDATAVLINALTFKGARPLGEAGKANTITAVADMTKGGEELKTILPDIEKAAKGAAPESLGDLLDTVNKAKDNMNMESGLAMQKIKGRQILPIGISNRIRQRITADMIQTAEGRSTENMIKKAALDFQKPWTFEQLDALRRRWWPDTKAYRMASPADRAALLHHDPRLAIKVDVVDAIRDLVYPEMDKAAGKPAGYFGKLKARQSTLIDLQKALDEQADRLSTESMRIKGTPRFSSKNVSFYAAGSTRAHPGFGIRRLHEVLTRADPARVADKSVTRAFAGKPRSKAVLYSYPLRQVLVDEGIRSPEQKKSPAQQIKDLHAIVNRTSSNPMIPTQEQ